MLRALVDVNHHPALALCQRLESPGTNVLKNRSCVEYSLAHALPAPHSSSHPAGNLVPQSGIGYAMLLKDGSARGAAMQCGTPSNHKGGAQRPVPAARPNNDSKATVLRLFTVDSGEPGLKSLGVDTRTDAPAEQSAYCVIPLTEGTPYWWARGLVPFPEPGTLHRRRPGAFGWPRCPNSRTRG